MLTVIVSWVLFRSGTISYAFSYLGAMVGAGDHALWCKTAIFQLRQYLPYFLACIIGIFPLKTVLANRLSMRHDSPLCRAALVWGPKFLALAALGLSYMKLATGSFNPFIYFQF